MFWQNKQTNEWTKISQKPPSWLWAVTFTPILWNWPVWGPFLFLHLVPKAQLGWPNNPLHCLSGRFQSSASEGCGMLRSSLGQHRRSGQMYTKRNHTFYKDGRNPELCCPWSSLPCNTGHLVRLLLPTKQHEYWVKRKKKWNAFPLCSYLRIQPEVGIWDYRTHSEHQYAQISQYLS